MPFPEGVVTTNIVETYLDASGKPCKGTAIFIPDMSAIGEGVAVAPVPVRKKLDATGSFSVLIPASVNTGLDPDFTYEYTLQLDGGIYSRRVYQIPASDDPVHIEDLVPVTPSPSTSRFVFPTHATAPSNPQPGEVYYNSTTGKVMVWDDVADVWVDVFSNAPGGAAGGSLAGTYPNPTLAANSVGTAQLVNDSVTADKLSVDYVPQTTYVNDLAITAAALGDLEETADTDRTNTTNALNLKAALDHEHPVTDITDIGTYYVTYANADIYYASKDDTEAALNLKANLASPTFTGTVSGISKSMVGLGNVNNTSDANKPVSTDVQTALNLKYDKTGGAISGSLTVSGVASFNGGLMVNGVPYLPHERLATSGEYVQRRKDCSTIVPISSGSIFISHFTALKTETILTLQTNTQGAGNIAVGGTSSWIGIMTWNGTQYEPLIVSADLATRWNTTFTEYNTAIYAATPGTGLANLGSPGWNKVAGQPYALWMIWNGSGTAPSLPCCTQNYADALTEPRDAGFMTLAAPPSSAIMAGWLSALGRSYQAWMRP
jgi:hypothetical protein